MWIYRNMTGNKIQFITKNFLCTSYLRLRITSHVIIQPCHNSSFGGRVSHFSNFTIHSSMREELYKPLITGIAVSVDSGILTSASNRGFYRDYILSSASRLFQ